MKIHQLPLGARFEYEGAEYVKTGPLFATGPGGQRLIPRSAVLRPLGGAGAGVSSPDLVRERVLAAFDTFWQECKVLVPETGQADLKAARRRFLQQL